MIFVNSKHEAQEAFLLIHFIEKWIIENTGKKAMIENEVLQEQKRYLRKYLKKENDTFLVRDFGMNGYIEKFYIEAENMEEAENIFDEQYRLIYYPSQYDCTGQLFTGCHWIFKTKYENVFVIYHRVCVDC